MAEDCGSIPRMRGRVSSDGGDEGPATCKGDDASQMHFMLPEWLANEVDDGETTTPASDPPAEHRSDAACTASLCGGSSAAEATGSSWAPSDDERG
eukprot:CAMPEP_0170330916 /NCGR_PEP_ID=MMETSP0116_2-20130129/66413_1 /TAXON_ID=400756 /ORGANISM="Durinskia baltica, Strain CSIRO CS-38" /LENGTH=95 /DNA_ID=CAMNT_0010584129 /DNA_START=35 /DNA_END=318 /DNA_ORIENTATION=+